MFSLEENGRFHLLLSEVLIRYMRFARNEPFGLAWNANDVQQKVCFL